MKIQNVGLDNAYAIVRGWVSDLAAAATGLISVTDETTGTTVGPVSSMTLVGQLINDGGGGNLVVDIQAVLTEYLNNSGVDLVYGDVVVIDTSANTAVTTTTTSQDTRPVGVVLANIGAGGTGPVQTGGVVQTVNVTASVTRGNFAETSTTAKKATENTAQRTGSFGIYLESGTTPTMLFLGANTTAAVGTYETVIQGGGSKIKAHSTMGSTETFDPADGNVHTGTLNANCTFTLTPPASATTACTMEFRITQDGTGGWTIIWPGSATVVGATPVTTASTETVYLVETLNGGTNWLVVVANGTPPSGSFATPAIVLGTAAAAGSAATVIRSDATIKAFNTVTPTAIAYGTVVGTSAYAAEADHGHNTPLSTKGDLLVTSGSVLNRLGVGTDAQLLQADSTATNGVSWVDAPVTGGPNHAHVADERHLSDGSTTTYTLDEFFLDGSVEAMNITTLAWLGVTETAPDQATVSAAGSSGDTIQFTYAAVAS